MSLLLYLGQVYKFVAVAEFIQSNVEPRKTATWEKFEKREKNVGGFTYRPTGLPKAMVGCQPTHAESV